MTVAKMKREIERLKLSQQDVAEMLGISQPTVSNILAGEHELTERNADAFVRGVARKEALTRVLAYPEAQGGLIRCNDLGGLRIDANAYLLHLDTCVSCLTRATLMAIE
jgi:transcriptional regulator with XRE-family HTH domain